MPSFNVNIGREPRQWLAYLCHEDRLEDAIFLNTLSRK